MSIDLEWSKLDSSLSTYLVDVLNKQLSNAERPSFIGPIEVTSLDFGSHSPDVELVDLRDIYRDFLDDDDDDSDSPLNGAPVKVTESVLDDDDGFEWVSRRAVGRELDHGPAPAYGRHLPQHLQYGLRGGPGASPSRSVSLDHPWAGGMNDFSPRTPWDNGPLFRSPTPSTPFSPGPVTRQTSDRQASFNSSNNPAFSEDLLRPLQTALGGMSLSPPDEQAPVGNGQPPGLAEQQQQQQQNPHPNLQLHFLINWQSNLRITITTSLLINYPSPMFMSLPIKLSVTGLVFSGEVAVAYEGERRRVHLCILDDQDPYGPAGDRPKRDFASSSDSSPTPGTPGVPPELDEDVSASRSNKPLPIGQRLLPSIVIESEIGQADKHVLKNVTRIEKFIQDVIRKTVEEELVFPNFHTLVMGEQ